LSPRVAMTISRVCFSSASSTSRHATGHMSRQIKAQLEQITRDEASDLTLDTHVLMGPVAWRLVELAEEKQTRLIVIATRGLSGLQGLLLGSVTERVVRSSPCPVLVLRHVGDGGEGGDGETEDVADA
ncbi:MAG: universal stress protein, partial [Acidobacteriota bacterium]